MGGVAACPRAPDGAGAAMEYCVAAAPAGTSFPSTTCRVTTAGCAMAYDTGGATGIAAAPRGVVIGVGTGPRSEADVVEEDEVVGIGPLGAKSDDSSAPVELVELIDEVEVDDCGPG